MVSKIFLNQLGRLDRALYVRLDRVRQRYVVDRRDRANRPREILVITTENGDFSYPNYEHIAKLYQMDMWQNPNMIKDMDEFNENKNKENDQKFSRIVRETTNRMTRTQYY